MDPTSANPHLTLDMFFLQHILSETACHCRYVADPQLHSSLCLLRYEYVESSYLYEDHKVSDILSELFQQANQYLSLIHI